MRLSVLTFFIGLLSLVCLGQNQDIRDIVIYDENHEATTINQEINDHPGKNYVVMLSTTGCGPCRSSLASWHNAISEWEQLYNLKIFLILRCSVTNADYCFSRYKSYDHDMYLYENSFNTLGVSGVPKFYFIDHDAQIVRERLGLTKFDVMEDIFNQLDWKNAAIGDQHYKVEVNASCDDSYIIEYDVISKFDGTYEVDGDIHVDGITIEYSSLESKDGQSIFPFVNVLCNDITVRDPISGNVISGKIIDEYVNRGHTLYETDIPLVNCKGNEEHFTIDKNLTSNAGLIPIITEEGIVSSLKCLKYDGKLLDWNGHDDCLTDTEEDPQREPLAFYPNPTSGMIYLSDAIHTKDITGIYDHYGINHIDKVNMLDHQVDLKGLANGLYLLKFKDQETSSLKVLVMR